MNSYAIKPTYSLLIANTASYQGHMQPVRTHVLHDGTSQPRDAADRFVEACSHFATTLRELSTTKRALTRKEKQQFIATFCALLELQSLTHQTEERTFTPQEEEKS